MSVYIQPHIVWFFYNMYVIVKFKYYFDKLILPQLIHISITVYTNVNISIESCAQTTENVN